MDREREKLIGARLRAFRETLQITRSKFAVTIGFGSERIASYEAGRAPLLYEVFRAIAKHYQINALWLAGNGGGPKTNHPFIDAEFIDKISNRALFSEVYDAYLADELEKISEATGKAYEARSAKLDYFMEKIRSESLPLELRHKMALEMLEATTKFNKAMEWENASRSTVNSKYVEILEKEDFTNKVSSLTSDDVQAVLPKLIQRLKRATEARGSKSELAAWLGVHRQSVTDWLSGKQEPGGEITLKLLHWVEQQERQK